MAGLFYQSTPSCLKVIICGVDGPCDFSVSPVSPYIIKALENNKCLSPSLETIVIFSKKMVSSETNVTYLNFVN